MQIIKLKTSQPKNILNIIINKNILKHPIQINNKLILIDSKDYKAVRKIFNNNYLSFKIINDF
jgi:hypothetical protein|tara:strand:+ start:225 stop:413 length:189 start_codon:yes stop_codon:yes gene_type:complete